MKPLALRSMADVHAVGLSSRWQAALGVIALLSLVAGAWLGLALLVPPAPLPASAPPVDFSAERAMRHVQVIAAKPTGWVGGERPVRAVHRKEVRPPRMRFARWLAGV